MIFGVVDKVFVVASGLAGVAAEAPVVMWQHVDQAEKSSVQEKKIRVVYLPPGGANAASTPLKNGTNGLTNGAVCLPSLLSVFL